MNCRVHSTILWLVPLLLFLCLAGTGMAGDKIEVVESEAGFYYTVQKGDTLWSLSKKFNNSPWLWPELWEENGQIANPHWIFPGERIRLYKRSGVQEVIQTGLPSGSILPPSPGTAATVPYFQYMPIDRVGFIRKPPVVPLGTLFDVQGEKVLISEGDRVYVRPEDPAADTLLTPGSLHTVFRYMAPTDEKDATKTIGTQHYLVGIVEIAQKEPELVTARVLKSFRDIQVGDMLMPFTPRQARIPLRPSTPGIDGQIIISEEHTALTGDHTVAFIDKGRADNIEVGQQYSIYVAQKIKNNAIDAKNLPPVDFGTFLVLHTEQTTATVIITQASGTISPGERFRTPVN